MKSYSVLSRAYDAFMEEIPYDAWEEHIRSVLKEEGISRGIVLDLACGSGLMTERLALAGYDMIGVDSSVDMLQEAMRKREEKGLDILYLCQDMTELDLYGTVAAAVSVCDSMNYLTSREDFVQTVSLVNLFLEAEAPFLFDMKTRHFYEETLKDGIFGDETEECALLWSTHFDSETQILRYEVSVFEEEEDGRYRRSDELHEQRAYSSREVEEMLLEGGLQDIRFYDGESYAELRTEEEREAADRWFIRAREKRKEGKYYET